MKRKEAIEIINGGCKLASTKYSTFIRNMNKKEILLNRVMVASLVIKEYKSFKALLEITK